MYYIIWLINKILKLAVIIWSIYYLVEFLVGYADSKLSQLLTMALIVVLIWKFLDIVYLDPPTPRNHVDP